MNNFQKISKIFIVFSLIVWTAQPAFVYAEEEVVEQEVEQMEQEQEEIIEEISEIEEDVEEVEEETEDEEEELEEVEVETGDTVALAEVENKVNLNNNEFGSGESGSEDEEKLEEELECDECEEGEEGNDVEGEGVNGENNQVGVLNNNEAGVETNVDGDSNSGLNSIYDNLADIDLETGDALLISNIFNLINFNVVGRDYLKSAYNLAGNIIGDLDLSRFSVEELAEEVEKDEEWQELELEIAESEGDEGEGEDGEFNIENDNQALVDNKVTVDVNSGLNNVSGNAGDVRVVTGNVSVVSNLVNIVNTNIIGDGWTLAIINIVGGWSGDLVLPSLTSYLTSQQDNFSLSCNDYDCLNFEIANMNQAIVNNDVSVVANSGANSVLGNDGEVEIYTGETNASSHITNQVNTNINNSGWVYGTVNVKGSWMGGFHGQPEDGFEVTNKDGGVVFTYTPEIVIDSEVDDSTSLDIKVNNDNSAEVNNIVEILANSGGNSVNGNGGDANLSTGDVFAMSNILNMINTNIVGDNWTLANINIIGDWEGDLYFGKPDLEILEVASPKSDPIMPGGLIDYIVTIINKGDLKASNVKVETDFDPELANLLDTDGGRVEGDKIIWELDEVGIGEIIIKKYSVQVATEEQLDDRNIYSPSVSTLSEVSSSESDRNLEDNIAKNDVIVGGSGAPSVNGFGMPVNAALSNVGNNYSSNQGGGYYNPTPVTIYSDIFELTKSNNSDGLVKQGQSVIYTLQLFNNSEFTVHDVYLYDLMFGPDGEVINEQYWPLGEVYPYEEITIQYTNEFSKEAPYGTYKNQTWADGFSDNGSYMIFPKKNNLVVIREPLDASVVSISIEPKIDLDKYLGEEDEEVLIVTNNGEVGLPQGQILFNYDSNYLQANNGGKGSSLIIPSIAAGESVEVLFTITGINLADRTQLDFMYLLDGNPITGDSLLYRVINDNRVYTNSQNRLQESAELIKTSENLVPKVLGISEVFADSGVAPDELQGGQIMAFANNSYVLFAWVLVIIFIVWLSFWQKSKQPKVVKVSKKK